MAPNYLSYSQIASWLTCRFLYYVSYILGLVPRRASVRMDLGAAVHAGLAVALRLPMFDPERNRSTTSDHLSEAFVLIDRTIRLWAQKLVVEVGEITDEEAEELEGVAELAIRVATRTVRTLFIDGWTTVYWTAPDGTRQPLVEFEFFFPIDAAPGRVKGYVDWVARDPDGKIFLVDHKVQEAFRDEAEEEFNFQMAVYQYALWVILGFFIHGSARHQIKGKDPSVPELNKPDKWGKRAMSRAAISTTWEVYETALLGAGLDPADYADMREKLKDTVFSKMSYAFRGEKEIIAVRAEFVAIAREMAQHTDQYSWVSVDHPQRPADFPRTITPRTCKSCLVRELCFEQMRGGDVDHIRDTQYRHRSEKDQRLIIVMED